MRLTFRQGIARYQTDVYATPAFLKKTSQTGDFIDLIVSPDPTIVIFAHRGSTYVIEENKTITKAWGPFDGSATRYLYWDINLLDATLTRGFTTLPQIVSATAPTNPANDQHWYDTTLHQMKVWNNGKWSDKLRVFAAVYSSQSVIQPFPLGTQVGENGSFDGGNIVLDSYNKPVRQSDATFVTSVTNLSVVNTSTQQIKLASEIVTGMAEENIPKLSFVQSVKTKKLKLARSDNWRSRIVGIVTEDLYSGEVGNIQTNGLIRNEQWHWPVESFGRPVFCGKTGEITLIPPQVGVLQIAGYVYDDNGIFLNIMPVTILDNVADETLDLPVGLPGTSPIAQFTSTPISGTAPLFVQFRSTSLHAPTKWEWDFKNDGTVDATSEEAGFTFTAPGVYSTRLKVSNQYGSHEIVKDAVVTVSAAAPASGINTNLDIQFSAPLQVAAKDNFTITVTVSNGGLLTATNVVRTIIIDDVNGGPIEITAKPSNSTVTHNGNQIILVMPAIPSMVTGHTVASTFSINAPKNAGLINLRAGVLSPEKDSTLSDNVASLSIRVK